LKQLCSTSRLYDIAYRNSCLLCLKIGQDQAVLMTPTPVASIPVVSAPVDSTPVGPAPGVSTTVAASTPTSTVSSPAMQDNTGLHLMVQDEEAAVEVLPSLTPTVSTGDLSMDCCSENTVIGLPSHDQAVQLDCSVEAGCSSDSHVDPQLESAADVLDENSNIFCRISPLPKKSFTDEKKVRRSRATSSRILTSKVHMKSVENELSESVGCKRKRSVAEDVELSSPRTKSKSQQKKRSKCSDKETKQDGNKKERRKKAIVREDTRRVKNLWEKGSKRSRKNKENRPADKGSEIESKSQEQCLCGGCGEPYETSTDDWLQCRCCESWYEITCAGMTGKRKELQDLFLCEECSSDSL